MPGLPLLFPNLIVEKNTLEFSLFLVRTQGTQVIKIQTL